MIAKKEWFKKKTFGWGITPKTWQAWTYTIMIIIPIISIQFFEFGSTQNKTFLTLGWIGFILIDLIPITIKLNSKNQKQVNKI